MPIISQAEAAGLTVTYLLPGQDSSKETEVGLSTFSSTSQSGFSVTSIHLADHSIQL